MTTSGMAVKRPGVVTLVSIYLWVVAITSVLVGIVFVIGSQNNDVIVETGRTETELLWAGITELVIGVLIILVALGLTSGASWARLAVAIVMVLRIAATIFVVAFNYTAGAALAGALHVLLPVFVLWALYGYDRSDEYFASQM